MDHDRAQLSPIPLSDTLLLSTPDRVRYFIRGLPVLPKLQVPLEDSCPICLLSFENIFEELEEKERRKGNTLEGGEGKDEDGEESGVTRVVGCGHLFCRRDLAQWIRNQHGNCPACRLQFVPSDILPPPREDDDESSDGGEYLPPSEVDDEYDYSFSEMEFDGLEEDWDPDTDIEPIPLECIDDLEDMRTRDAEMWGMGCEDDYVEREAGSDCMWGLEDEAFDYFGDQAAGADVPTQDQEEELEVELGLTDEESNRSTSSGFTTDLDLENDALGHTTGICVQISANGREDDVEGVITAPLEAGLSK